MRAREGSVPRLGRKDLVDDVVPTARGVIAHADALAVVPTQARSDQAIADAIVEELQRRVTVDPTGLDVAVVDGFVTLDGSVPTRSGRDGAIATARRTAGVVGVRDKLSIA